MGVKIKKGDNVLIISGKDKGRTAKILKALPKENKVLIDGINLRQKHVKPKRQGEKGQIVKVPVPMNVSGVKFICPKCGKAVRLGYKIIAKKAGEKPARNASHSDAGGTQKHRICKKCKSEV